MQDCQLAAAVAWRRVPGAEPVSESSVASSAVHLQTLCTCLLRAEAAWLSSSWSSFATSAWQLRAIVAMLDEALCFKLDTEQYTPSQYWSAKTAQLTICTASATGSSSAHRALKVCHLERQRLCCISAGQSQRARVLLIQLRDHLLHQQQHTPIPSRCATPRKTQDSILARADATFRVVSSHLGMRSSEV